MSEVAEGTSDWPGWLQEFDHALSFQPQFVLAGNIRDLHSVPTADGLIHVQTADAIWALLQHRGFEYLIAYDPVDAMQVLAPRVRESWPSVGPFERLQSRPGNDVAFSDLAHFVTAVQPATGAVGPAGALIIDYASRIGSPPAGTTPDHDHLFVTSEKAAHRARPRGSTSGSIPPYNPIIWLANQASDIPDWFRIGNEAVRTIVIGLPDRSERQRIVDRAATGFYDYANLGEDERAKLMLQFVLLTEGMTIRAMYAVQELARTRRFGLARIADAIRAYRIGSSEDPWKEDSVRASIRTAEEEIAKEVKGQGQAIFQTTDILKRSVTGLTGAHVGRSGNRPRGVLFLAGPTGVGKTELAKQVTKILFGDEGAYHRFDMSEFSSEQSEARLIGAPPGYVGHDAGGELVNAIRRRPFSVILFDEIEKAHPRILDKFLQILEDGRLTDGRGDTVYFSEAVIIFTSNLGIYGEELQGDRYVRVPKVTPETALNQAEVEAIVRPEIEKHFRFELKRPELLNRIGDNIVVFDFIREAVALEILDKMVANVMQRVAEETGRTLTIGKAALTVLQQQAISAASEYGGRGIGNRLEACLVNPLARVLFDTPPSANSRTICVERIERIESGWEVVLQ